MDYYDDKFERTGDLLKTLFWSLLIMVLCCLLGGLVSGCRSIRTVDSTVTDTRESERELIEEKIRFEPVTINVEIPHEYKERETRDTSSVLETAMARSQASVKWEDGVPVLFHSLEDIPQTISRSDSVAVKERTRTVWRTRRVTVNRTKVVERQPSLWQKIQLWGGRLAAFSLFLVILVFWFRKIVLRR